MKQPTQAELQKIVDDFNAAHPVGTAVTRYKLINPLREPQQTKTTTKAWVMGGHSAVVKVEGVTGCVLVESVVVDKGETLD